MANARVHLNSKMDNKQNTRGSSLLKTSIISDDDFNTLLEEVNKEDENIETKTTTTPTFDSTLGDNITNSVNSDSEVSFNSGIRKLKYRLENEEDIKKLGYDIDVIICKTINDVQITYEPGEKGMVEKRYIDKVNNGNLLNKTINEVKSLILKTNMDRYEMNDYFTDLIDNCIHERFKFIIQVGLDNNLSPNEIKILLSGFVSDTEELDQDTVKDYINEYMDFVCDIIFNRVKNNTFMIKELIAEALRLIDEESNDGISYIVNNLLYKAIDEKYIKLAKINIENRPPKHSMVMKDLKKRMRNK